MIANYFAMFGESDELHHTHRRWRYFSAIRISNGAGVMGWGLRVQVLIVPNTSIAMTLWIQRHLTELSANAKAFNALIPDHTMLVIRCDHV